MTKPEFLRLMRAAESGRPGATAALFTACWRSPVSSGVLANNTTVTTRELWGIAVPILRMLMRAPGRWA